MHKPSEPESLRRGSQDGTDAPCNCPCVKGREPSTEQPQTNRAAVYSLEYVDINGDP
jgi:hypothetical protein